MIAALDPADLSDVSEALHGLQVPTMLIWGTDDATFGLKWAYQLRDTIPGVQHVIEVAGAKTFFPLERPDDLAGHLRNFWGR